MAETVYMSQLLRSCGFYRQSMIEYLVNYQELDPIENFESMDNLYLKYFIKAMEDSTREDFQSVYGVPNTGCVLCSVPNTNTVTLSHSIVDDHLGCSR